MRQNTKSFETNTKWGREENGELGEWMGGSNLERERFREEKPVCVHTTKGPATNPVYRYIWIFHNKAWDVKQVKCNFR